MKALEAKEEQKAKKVYEKTIGDVKKLIGTSEIKSLNIAQTEIKKANKPVEASINQLEKRL